MITDPEQIKEHILHMQVELFLAKINGDPDCKVTIWRQYYIPLLRMRLERAQNERRAAQCA